MTASSEKINGSTEMSANIREFPWQTTSLGSVSNWDNNLIVYVNMMLACPFPMMIWWGKEKIQLYNDACKKLPGIRHHLNSKKSLGLPAEKSWPEAWPTIKKKLEILKNTPLGVFEEDQMIPICKGDQLEPVYWTFSYSCLQNEKGDNEGILIVFKETTKSNIELRNKKEKEAFLLRLGDQLRGFTDKKKIETESGNALLSLFDFKEIGFGEMRSSAVKLIPHTKIVRNNSDILIDTFDEKSPVEYLDVSVVAEDLSYRKAKVYQTDHDSVFITKINEEQENYRYLYVVSKIDDDWDQYKKSTVAEASKRIGEFLSIAEAQKNLVVSEARYRSLFENILDAFMVIDFSFDASGSPSNYTFLTTNPAFEIQTGLKNVVGKTILEIMPEVEKEWIEGYGKVAITGEPAKFEQYNNATKRHYEVFASSVTDYPSQVVVVFRDITERKLETESRKKFLNVASHELKTPLTSIYSSIQLAQKMISRQKIERASSLLEKSLTSLTKMTKIINGFLHLSNLEDPEVVINKEIFNISEFVKNSCEEARLLHPSHQFIVNSGNCKNILADKDKIRLVLQNLITNAVQYSSHHSIVKLSCISIDEKVNITVEDQGMGLDDIAIKNILKKFFRVHDNPISGVSGLGLGLYVCSKILKRHDSELIIESIPGEGSKFSFSLNTI